MAGLCKDYASITYGLIKQNDNNNVFKARFGFIKDHVFVEADIDNEVYVIDAWRTAGNVNDGVILKTEHLTDLNNAKRGGGKSPIPRFGYKR